MFEPVASPCPLCDGLCHVASRTSMWQKALHLLHQLPSWQLQPTVTQLDGSMMFDGYMIELKPIETYWNLLKPIETYWNLLKPIAHVHWQRRHHYFSHVEFCEAVKLRWATAAPSLAARAFNGSWHCNSCWLPEMFALQLLRPLPPPSLLVSLG